MASGRYLEALKEDEGRDLLVLGHLLLLSLAPLLLLLLVAVGLGQLRRRCRGLLLLWCLRARQEMGRQRLLVKGKAVGDGDGG